VELGRAYVPREAVARLVESIQGSSNDIVIHTNTGTFTAEAREPDRKKRMFLQLQHARRLCIALEAAAAESTSDARSLIEEHKANICELTCLTEAFFQRYTLDSYQYYTHQLQHQQYKHQQRVDSAKELLFGTLRDWYEERKSSSSQPLQESEQPQQPLNVNASTKTSTQRRRRAKGAGHPKKEEVIVQKKKRKQSPTTNYTVGDDSERLKEGEGSSQKMAAAVNDAKAGTANITTSPALSSSNNTNTSYSQSTEPCAIDTLSSTIEPSTAAPFEKAARRRGGAIPALRRCHHCKNTSRTYLRCNFFHITGFKCLKLFCKTCLTSFYDLEDFDDAKKNEHDWFCPSCLGNCRCPSCTKLRERREGSRSQTRLRQTL
jgi:hypothetical protein